MLNEPSDNAGRRRRFVYAAITLVFGLAAVLILGDIALRWWELRDSHSPLAYSAARQRSDQPHIYDQTPSGLRLRRFLDTRITDPISGREVSFRTNALGFRGPPIAPKESGEYRILVLGDSITLSSYTEEDESYPTHLERFLSIAGRRIRVINAGMYGAGLREELLILNEGGLLTQPDLVLVGLFLNDAQRSRMFPLPEGLLTYSAIARRLAEINTQQELSNEARERYERLTSHSFPSQSFAKDAWRMNRAAFEAQVAAACTDWGFGFFPQAWDEMRPDFEVLDGLSRRFGFKLAIALFPATIQVEADFLDDRPQQMFVKEMDEMKIRHLDLLPALRKAYRAAGHSLSYDHGHLTPEGNRIVAQTLDQFLQPLVVAPTTSPAAQ